MVRDSCANEPTDEEGGEEDQGWCGVGGCGGVTVRRRAMLMLREMFVHTSDAPLSAWVVDRSSYFVCVCVCGRERDRKRDRKRREREREREGGREREREGERGERACEVSLRQY
jgi:hypothetical protein